jgi:hypothetical protein
MLLLLHTQPRLFFSLPITPVVLFSGGGHEVDVLIIIRGMLLHFETFSCSWLVLLLYFLLRWVSLFLYVLET